MYLTEKWIDQPELYDPLCEVFVRITSVFVNLRETESIFSTLLTVLIGVLD